MFAFPGEPEPDQIRMAVEEAINRMTLRLLEASNPQLELYKFAVATGINVTMGDCCDVRKMLKRFGRGITKQALQQGVEQIREEYGLRITHVMRSDEARNNMRLSNYRGHRMPRPHKNQWNS